MVNKKLFLIKIIIESSADANLDNKTLDLKMEGFNGQIKER